MLFRADGEFSGVRQIVRSTNDISRVQLFHREPGEVSPLTGRQWWRINAAAPRYLHNFARAGALSLTIRQPGSLGPIVIAHGGERVGDRVDDGVARSVSPPRPARSSASHEQIEQFGS
jgi:hypothetical protein